MDSIPPTHLTDAADGVTIRHRAPELGALLGGRYRVDELIGRGGMGLVYRGRHMELEVAVAIKIIRPELAGDPGVVARFIEEARVTASVHHERVVRVNDLGNRPGGEPFMVLELLEGPDLETLLAQRGPLPIATAVAYAIDVCSALGAIHRRSLVHCDVKPSNLAVVHAGVGLERLKILDFGIASGAGMSCPLHPVNATLAVGSPHHMSPEQLTGASIIDGRSDIWSFGVVVYQMLVGQLPFVGDDVPSICAQVLSHEPPEPMAVRADVPKELSELVARALRKDPRQRPQEVSLVAWELRQIARRLENAMYASSVDLAEPPSSMLAREDSTVRRRASEPRSDLR